MAGRIFNAALLAASLALATLAPAAHAGQYHVYSCRTPNGESAPVDGWSGSVSGAFVWVGNTCGQSDGSLIAALGYESAHPANSDIGTWEFGAPPNERISAATLWRAGDADGGGVIGAMYEFWFAGPVNGDGLTEAFGFCVSGMQCPFGVGNFTEPLASVNRLVVPANSLGTHLFVDASCVGESGFACPSAKGDADGDAVAVDLFAADLTLEQSEGPSASDVGGELASAPAVQGQSDLTFDASDPGSGVYEAVFSVDGRVVQRTVLDSNGGRCDDAGQTSDGLPAFLYVLPCPRSVSADVPFDTSSVSNGVHHLVVSVTDAAGNAAPVLDKSVTIDNPPPPGAPNGTNATTQAALSVRWRDTAKASAVSSYGRAQTIVGRLTGPTGVPIVGAAIDLRASPDYAGAAPVQMTSPRTNPEGRFSVRIPAGSSSRSLRFAYRARVGDTVPVASRTLTLTVRASIALSVAPHVTSVGRTIHFRGHVRGGPIPRGGKELVLEARSPGSPWVEFKVVRTDAHGRYRASYRFKFAGPASYRFRARSEAESDFPYAGGSSNVVAVHER
jgi:hypothetical protein